MNDHEKYMGILYITNVVYHEIDKSWLVLDFFELGIGNLPVD